MKNYTFIFIILLIWQTVLFYANAQSTNSGYAKVNGTSIYYEVTGEGAPLVFIHGYTCNHKNWEPQVKYFSDKFKVITFDLRAHGKSAVPDTVAYSYVDDLSALLDYLKVDKAYIVGHSLGGLPAFFYALNYPEKTLGLILAEGGPAIIDPKLVDIEKVKNYFGEINGISKTVTEEGIDSAKVAWLNISPLKTSIENPQSSELIRTMINEYSGWHWINKDPEKGYPPGTPELFSQIKAPTLIISGDLSHDAIKEMVSIQDKYIPNSKKVVLKNSNHMLNIENPDGFNKALSEFFKMYTSK